MSKKSEPKVSRYKTPLRYPGGKQRLAPFILEVLEKNNLVGGEYAEPYAGGAGVAIELLLSGKVSKIHLNDSSRAVHYFWYAILNHTDEFCRRIEDAKMTIDEWRLQREILSQPDRFSSMALGYSLFFLNRCNRSGIPSPTAGVIGGLKQEGIWKMDARFPRKELVKRIRAIADKKDSIVLKNWDAEEFIKEYIPKLPEKTLVYCDPPYYHKAKRLYLNHYKHDDHERIADVIQKKITHPWLVSYDGVPEIIALYEKRKHFIYDLQYNAGRAYKGKEVFVFSDNLNVPEKSVLPSVDKALKDAA